MYENLTSLNYTEWRTTENNLVLWARLSCSPAFSEYVPIMLTPTSLGVPLLSMQHKSLIGI